MRHFLLPVAVAGLLLNLTSRASAQDDPRALIEQAIRAQGGEDKLAAARITREKSKGTWHESNLTMTYTAIMSARLPDRFHYTMEVDIQGAKMHMEQAFKGGKGWMKLDNDVQDIPEDGLEDAQQSLYVAHLESLIPLLKDKGLTLKALGESKVGDRAALGVRVASPGQTDVDLFFDKENGLLVKTVTRVKDGASKEKVLQEINYHDYQEVNLAAVDEQAFKAAKRPSDGPALLELLRKLILTDADRDKIQTLIRQLGDANFQVREQATTDLVTRGVAARSLLRQAAKNPDPEIARRAERCLERIEADTATPLAPAAVRLIALRKPAGAAEVLLAYLPFAQDESVARDVRSALAAVALHDGKPDKALLAALDDKDPARRAAAALVLGRDGKSLQDQPGYRLFPTGLKAPRKVVIDRDGKRSREWEVTEVEFFTGFDDSLFAKP